MPSLNHILQRNFSGCWKAPCEHQCGTFALLQVLFHTGNIHCHPQGMTVSAVLSSWHGEPPAFHSGRYSTAFHKPPIPYLWSAWVAQQTVSSNIVYPCSGLMCKTLIVYRTIINILHIFIYVSQNYCYSHISITVKNFYGFAQHYAKQTREQIIKLISSRTLYLISFSLHYFNKLSKSSGNNPALGCCSTRFIIQQSVPPLLANSS